MHQLSQAKASSTASERRTEAERVSKFVAQAVERAPGGDEPFSHLVLDHIFPEETYASMLAAMPEYDDYRPMGGRSKQNTSTGKSTRVKIDLFPEYIMHLPPEKREIWDIVGRALCSQTVKEAFIQRMATPLERRFEAGYAQTGFFPIPILTRDIPGYKIKPHTDTHWKGITVQLYLPADASTSHIGTIFHERQPDTSLKKVRQMQFVPNSGYAFVVGDDTWHSADPVGAEVKTRDSILLTYFVDTAPLRYLRNRFKRVCNFSLNEFRRRVLR
jgi:hypothetical protein